MTIVKLPDARLFFPDLFTAMEFKGKTRYRSVFAFPKDGPVHKAVEAAILEVATEKWGKKAQNKIDEFRPVKQQFCLRDGDKVDYEGAEGMMVLTANRDESKGRPLVIDRDKSPLAAKDGRPYSGCYVNGSVEIWAMDGENSGVWCTLRGVQFNRDGDSFSGGSKADLDEFEDLGAGADTDDLV